MFSLPKTLEGFAGKNSLDCLALFRHFMVDVITTSSHGYRLGALSKWASGVEEPLSTAIGDFPKRGILVRFFLFVGCVMFSFFLNKACFY